MSRNRRPLPTARMKRSTSRSNRFISDPCRGLAGALPSIKRPVFLFLADLRKSPCPGKARRRGKDPKSIRTYKIALDGLVTAFVPFDERAAEEGYQRGEFAQSSIQHSSTFQVRH